MSSISLFIVTSSHTVIIRLLISYKYNQREGGQVFNKAIWKPIISKGIKHDIWLEQWDYYIDSIGIWPVRYYR